MRVLVVNVFYPPVAFGGATIVAEQTTTLLSRMPDTDCLVLCLDAIRPRESTDMTRYVWDGVDVVATSSAFDDGLEYQGLKNAAANEDVIRNFRPDVALVHCIQDLGAEVLTTLKQLGVPVALFVHDAWWICERQFMVNAGGAYCYQAAVDLEVCRYCVNDIEATRRRDRYLRTVLAGVDTTIFPSEFFRALHIASGLSNRNAAVVVNGIVTPRPTGRMRPADAKPVRFGFLGGLGPIKGSGLVRSVFDTLPRRDYELVCVDNTAKVGIRSVPFRAWSCTGSLRLRDGFTQGEIDAFYDEIDVLLFPSQWKESFGLAVREALARHKWVIVTDGGGTAEDVVDGVNGTVIPISLDPAPLRDAALACFDRDWSTYRNPYADRVRTFPEQANELRAIMAALVAARAPTAA